MYVEIFRVIIKSKVIRVNKFYVSFKGEKIVMNYFYFRNNQRNQLSWGQRRIIFRRGIIDSIGL